MIDKNDNPNGNILKALETAGQEVAGNAMDEGAWRRFLRIQFIKEILKTGRQE